MSLPRSLQQRSRNCLLDSQTRLDLARRLHDGLAQDLALLGYRLDEVIGDPLLEQGLRDALRQIRLEFAAITTAFRDEIYRIRQLNRSDLSDQLAPILGVINRDVDLDYPELNESAEDAIAQSLLEIARNCAHHSGASQFTLRWRLMDRDLIIECTDDGSGEFSIKERSFGLRGITERLSAIGSTIEFLPHENGTRIVMNIPNYNRLAR